MLQLVIVTVLFFVLFFGIGFILNMLLKTTWFPVYAYIALIAGLLVYYSMDGTIEKMAEFTIVDYIPAAAGLMGAYFSGKTIRILREKGYRMF